MKILIFAENRFQIHSGSISGDQSEQISVIYHPTKWGDHLIYHPTLCKGLQGMSFLCHGLIVERGLLHS